MFLLSEGGVCLLVVKGEVLVINCELEWVSPSAGVIELLRLCGGAESGVFGWECQRDIHSRFVCCAGNHCSPVVCVCVCVRGWPGCGGVVPQPGRGPCVVCGWPGCGGVTPHSGRGPVVVVVRL